MKKCDVKVLDSWTQYVLRIMTEKNKGNTSKNTIKFQNSWGEDF